MENVDILRCWVILIFLKVRNVETAVDTLSRVLFLKTKLALSNPSFFKMIDGGICFFSQIEHERIAHQKELNTVTKAKDKIIGELKQANVRLQGHLSQSSTGNVRVAVVTRCFEMPILSMSQMGYES